MSGLLPALGGGAGAGGIIPLAAGGLSGVLAMSALIAGGVVPVGGDAAHDLVVSACQGQGSVAVARPGEQMLATGKSADGAYLRVYVPGPLGEGWVPAKSVELLADGSALPIAGCDGVGSATAVPRRSPSASESATTSLRPTPSPTATPSDAPTIATTPTPTEAKTLPPTPSPATTAPLTPSPTRTVPPTPPPTPSPTRTPPRTPSPTPRATPTRTLPPQLLGEEYRSG